MADVIEIGKWKYIVRDKIIEFEMNEDGVSFQILMVGGTQITLTYPSHEECSEAFFKFLFIVSDDLKSIVPTKQH